MCLCWKTRLCDIRFIFCNCLWLTSFFCSNKNNSNKTQNIFRALKFAFPSPSWCFTSPLKFHFKYFSLPVFVSIPHRSYFIFFINKTKRLQKNTQPDRVLPLRFHACKYLALVSETVYGPQNNLYVLQKAAISFSVARCNVLYSHDFRGKFVYAFGRCRPLVLINELLNSTRQNVRPKTSYFNDFRC